MDRGDMDRGDSPAQAIVECTLFCNLESWAQTHAVLVIGLYELLGNTTT
jgi:hypothetical protein